MRGLRAAALAVACLVLCAQDLDPAEFRWTGAVTLPAAEGEWARLDVPAALHAFLPAGFDDLRLVDGAGSEVERLVLAGWRVGRGTEEVLPYFDRSRSENGRTIVGVTLAGPRPAPSHLRLPGAARGGGPVQISVGERADDLRLLVEVAEPATEGADLLVPLPPFVGALLRVEAPRIESVVAAWRTALPERRVALECAVVSRRRLRDGFELILDLRVAAAPALELELEFRGRASGDVSAGHSASPDGPWKGLLWAPDDSTPPGVVRGRVLAPGPPSSRWVRVHVPSRNARYVRLVRDAATIRRSRVYFRPAGITPPLRLLAGRTGLRPPAYALASGAAAWDMGSPASLSPPPWPVPLGPRYARLTTSPAPPSRPTPWAALVASLLAAALLVAMVVWRR